MPNLPSLTKTLLDSGCPTFARLQDLRERGSSERSLDQQFVQKQRIADRSSRKADDIHFECNKTLMKSILKEINILPILRLIQFLDLGCCPGGFASAILARYQKAGGVGVSLPQKVSGIGRATSMPVNEKKRLRIHWQDLTFYDICCPPNCPPPEGHKELSPFPGLKNIIGEVIEKFQLVILDGLHRRQQHKAEDPSQPLDMVRLGISQLIIALQTIEEGGTIIIALHKMEQVTTAQIVFLLDSLSSRLVMYKSSNSHAAKNMFYAIAIGAGKGKECAKLPYYLDRLKRLWWDLTYCRREERGIWLNPSDLEFIVDQTRLETEYLGRLKELGEIVWKVQADRIEQILKRNEEKQERNRDKNKAKSIQEAQGLKTSTGDSS